MKHNTLDRREFLRWGLAFTAGAPLAFICPPDVFAADARIDFGQAFGHSPGCEGRNRGLRSYYGPEVLTALQQCFDLVEGIGSLVKNKTVTVKLIEKARYPYKDALGG